MNARQILLPGAPARVQRKRSRGWRMPDNTVYVGRGSKWGNPCKVGMYRDYTAADAVRDYRKWLARDLTVRSFDNAFGAPPTIEDIRTALAGKNVACWCAPGAPCHADILLEIANSPEVAL